MPENHQQIAGGSNQPKDPLDALLDAALAKYAAAEPRAGLEERILANLQAGSGHALPGNWWRWKVVFAAVGMAAVVLVIATLTLRTNMWRAPAITHHPATEAPRANDPEPLVAAAGAGTHALALAPATRHAPHRPHAAAVTATNPKLDQFPSPQPPSQEELALRRYVSQFPQDATLIARAQEEFEKEIRQIMKDQHSDTEFSNSDQQER